MIHQKHENQRDPDNTIADTDDVVTHTDTTTTTTQTLPVSEIARCVTRNEREIDVTNTMTTNFEDSILLLFASNKKMEEYRKQKGYSFFNPFALLASTYFSIVSDKYVHVEIAFRSRHEDLALITFTATNDDQEVKVKTRKLSELYENFSITISKEEKMDIFDFLKGCVGKKFDKLGSFRMPFFPELNYEKEDRQSYYCVSLVILALQRIGLMKTLVCNCVTIDELFNIVKADERFTFTLPPAAFEESRLKAFPSNFWSRDISIPKINKKQGLPRYY